MFQKAYNWIKNWQTPTWLVVLLGEIQILLIGILEKVGKDIISEIEHEIIKVNDMNITDRQKFDRVFNFAVTKLDLTYLTDSAINLLIEVLVSRLKDKRII